MILKKYVVPDGVRVAEKDAIGRFRGEIREITPPATGEHAAQYLP